jgi:hypothetical protein
MVVATRNKNWMIYSLSTKRTSELMKNLKCLRECVQSNPIFARDLRELARLQRTGCVPPAIFAGIKTKR